MVWGVVVAVAALVAVAVGLSVWAMATMMRSVDELGALQRNDSRSILGELSGIARTVDDKFSFYVRDPKRVLAVSDDADAALLSVRGAAASSLMLGDASLSQGARGLTITSGQGTLVVGDAGVEAGPSLRIGPYKLVARPEGLQVCDAAGRCTLLMPR